ncbi:MAG: GAF domain-containing protein [Alphaproteobacteria bacterium]|nr:GAF domain-containing protein [Alphaproteobacteria bacterium]
MIQQIHPESYRKGTPEGDAPRVEVALVPADSEFSGVVQRAALAAGASFVPVDLASAADVVGRVLVVDLTRVMVAQQLGRRVIAISPRLNLDCYDVVPPHEVGLRMPRVLKNLVEAEALRGRIRQEREIVRILNEIGFSLSAITDTDELLDRVLTHARAVLRADGGSIYLLEDGRLRFAASQNDTIRFRPSRPALEVDDRSLAGYVAGRGIPLRIDDLDKVPHTRPYRPNHTNDQRLGYRTRSALLVPMQDRDEEVFGVLALYNRKPVAGAPLASFDRVMPFTDPDEDLARSIASQAAVALESHRLYQDIRKLFDGFVTAAVTVIEARDPSTAGHSHRVARLTTRMARAVSESDEPAFAGQRFTDGEIEELHYASILHDFGKVGVPEHVLLKADKLYPWELESLEFRFHLAALRTRLEGLRMALADTEVSQRLAILDADLALVRRMNRSGVRFTEADVRRLQAIAARWWLEDLNEPVLRNRDVMRLCIPRGSLDPEERRAIELHVTHTYNFLKVIPWTKGLRRVPELAHAHHEKLDGTGYPLRLTGEQIPYGARLMTIADIFDALTAGDRPYKAGMTAQRAVRILREEADAGRIQHEAVELMVAQRLWEGIIAVRLD